MWCRTVRKLVHDYVDGLVEGRMAANVRSHLDRCVKCAAEEESARALVSSLAAWEDLPAPEDGLHRLETRLAFVPAMPAAPRPKGRLITFALPYFAGAASAAAIMLALLPLLRPDPAVPTAPTTNSPVAMEEKASPELLPGEQELRYREVQAVVDEHGNLIELPGRWRQRIQPLNPEDEQGLGMPFRASKER
jgi:anti-sigma factor RsiW